MNINPILIRKLTGLVSLIVGVALLPSAICALIYGELHMVKIFLLIFAALAALGLALFLPVRRSTHQIRTRDAFFIVTMCWITASLAAAAPYCVSGVLPNYADAFFEAVSNITTTGANLIASPETIPKSLLFWRSLISWIGGMGILLFVISVLPALGIGTANLANAETGGSSIEKYKLRLSENAKYVYMLYISLSAAEFLLLLAGRMNPFDALLNTFSSISNCGLSNYTEGISYFNSVYIEIIIAIFCILGATNFSTLQLLPRRKARVFLREPEIRAYGFIIAFALVVITPVLLFARTYGSFADTVRNSFLQIISFVTTAGYSVINYNEWPVFCKMLLFFVLFIGGCSASTAGGIKVSRFLVMLMLIRRNLYKRLHPNAVYAVKIGERAIPADKVSNITVFVIVYGVIFCAGSILLSLDGQDMETTTGSVIAALSNTGLGFGAAGYGSTFEVFSVWGRSLLSVLMLLGRLELFAFLILFTPSFWRGNR
ncbi:MAG: TrkH family potassium uptake protein [Clostridiales Family XIII bacterium]|jgi:trk system potassium uptake protein TrkH|nr:TrkH family potassium uptake protein [Clostridiales Family XIII bacterium]